MNRSRGSNKCRRLDPRNIKPFPAPHVLAHHLVVEQDHVAGRLLELRAVPLVGVAREPVDLGAQQPAQVVGVCRPAKGAVQRNRLSRIRFFVELFFVHKCYPCAALSNRVAIARPARVPSATASTTSRPPLTQSPPAKYRGFVVWPVALSP